MLEAFALKVRSIGGWVKLVDVNTGYLIYLKCHHNRKGHEIVLSSKNKIITPIDRDS